jgi:DNA replication protein DnaC
LAQFSSTRFTSALRLAQRRAVDGHRVAVVPHAAQQRTRRLLNRLSRLDVLLIDEFGYLNLKPEQSNTFFKLMEERYHRHSTIITTNLVYDEWHNFLGNKPMVDALLSRVRHYCHTVTIDGPSLREPQS